MRGSVLLIRGDEAWVSIKAADGVPALTKSRSALFFPRKIVLAPSRAGKRARVHLALLIHPVSSFPRLFERDLRYVRQRVQVRFRRKLSRGEIEHEYGSTVDICIIHLWNIFLVA